MPSLQEQFGDIDIYLFDQLLRRRITSDMRVLDAGCGHGRNLVYLLREGYDVYGVDSDPQAIADIRRLAYSRPPNSFRVEAIESMSFPDAFADVVISNAVLHFANSTAQFLAMVRGMWRVLRPGGMLFCRLASAIGVPGPIQALGDRRYLLRDGSERFLVDEEMLMEVTHALGGELIDPLKTTIVQNQRSMTTWVVRKGS